jgi:hypothetical protein
LPPKNIQTSHLPMPPNNPFQKREKLSTLFPHKHTSHPPLEMKGAEEYVHYPSHLIPPLKQFTWKGKKIV